MDNGKNLLGRRVKEARLRAGLTQSALARQAGVQTQAISNIEIRGSDARGSTVLGIAAACGVTAQWLLTGDVSGTAPLAFYEFLECSPLARSATPRERNTLESIRFEDPDEPGPGFYERLLLDVRAELRRK